MRARNKKVVLAATMVVAGTLAGLVLAELALRLTGFAFAMYPTEVKFGWPDPLSMKDFFDPDPQVFWVTKGYAPQVAAWAGIRPSMIFMGDSCTQWGNYDKFLASLIKEKYPQARFTYGNVGITGWSSYQGLQQLRRDVLPMQPRAIMIYYGWNDHWCSCGIEDKAIHQFIRQPIFLPALSQLRVVQLVNSALFRYEHPVIAKGGRKPERVSLPDFTANLQQMVHLALEHGITPVLLTAPSSHRIGAEPPHLAERYVNDLRDVVPLHQAYAGAVRAVASQTDMPLVDLYAEFNQLSEEELNKLFESDGVHLTEAGDRKIAASLYEHLARYGLIERLIKKD